MHFCTAAATEAGGAYRNRQKNAFRGSDSSSVRECFKEYPLEDKIDVLRKMLVHNEKRVEEKGEAKISSTDARDSLGVKQCLKLDKKTPFGTVIWELRNTVMNSYWNKEVSKTRYPVPNLPIGMDILNTTFGKVKKSDSTVAELLNPKSFLKDDFDPECVHKMYRYTHHHYKPSERINRNYNAPFHPETCFGQKGIGKLDGSRIKGRMNWPETVNEAEKSGEKCVDLDITYGKRTQMEEYGAPKAICDYFANERELCLQKYLTHLNTLRLKFKKRMPEIPFLDIYQELISCDKEFTGVLPEDAIYNVLAKYKMFVNKSLLSPLLDLLKLRENGNVKHRELVNLLNWKFDIPTLPKLSTMPAEHQHYNTAYRDEINRNANRKCEDTRAAGLPSSRWDLPFVIVPRAALRCDRDHLGDQTIAYSMVAPSIFTRYGLSHIDFFKTRDKEEIRSIFENIGVQFPDDSFEKLWEEALKKDSNGGVCVETFRTLIHRRKDILENKNE